MLFRTPYGEVTQEMEHTDYIRSLRSYNIPVPHKYHKLAKQVQVMPVKYQKPLMTFFALHARYSHQKVGRKNWPADIYATARLLRDFNPSSSLRIIGAGKKHTEVIMAALSYAGFNETTFVQNSTHGEKCLILIKKLNLQHLQK